MTRFISVLSLIGCTDVNSTTDTSSVIGNDTESVVKGFLNVKAMIDGSDEPASIIINGKVVGTTGTDIALAPGTYTFYMGDNPTSTSDDGIPLHTAGTAQDGTVWEKSSWIHPPVTVTILEGETVSLNDESGATPEASDDALVLNVWRPAEWWTCDDTCSWTDCSGAYTSMVSYTGGEKFVLPFGEVMMNGTSFSMSSSLTGELTSPIEATATDQQTDIDSITTGCFKSDEDGNKVDIGGNVI